MGNEVTLKDLARNLNVSISTVSKALRDSPEISIDTKKRIVKAAEKFRYQPNAIALSLKNRSTGIIGVVIPDIHNYFFVNALSGIENEIRKQGYRLVTCISNESIQMEKESIQELLNGRVDGIILSLSHETQQKSKFDHLLDVMHHNIPIVQFDRVTSFLPGTKVVSDNYSAAYEAVKVLFRTGVKTIFLAVTNNELSVVKERMNGFLEAVKKLYSSNSNPVIYFENLDECEDEIRRFLKSNKNMGVVSVDEMLSVKLVKCAMQLGIKILRSFKLIGFSNGELSKEYYPSISSIDQHSSEMGMVAAANLIKAIKNKELLGDRTNIIKSKLVKRSTT
jgi:LacI family transcriptional regulator